MNRGARSKARKEHDESKGQEDGLDRHRLRTGSKRRASDCEVAEEHHTCGEGDPRGFCKKQIILELLRRDGGVTMAEMAKVTGWQNHSIRGFLSGHVAKKMALAVESSKGESGNRTYRIK